MWTIPTCGPLYDDATFSNGEPVTGEDVYWSWYRNISENSSVMNCFCLH